VRIVDVNNVVLLYRFSALLQVLHQQLYKHSYPIQDAFFQTARVNNSQPTRKATPPNGVIMPSVLTPEMTMAYNEPENRIIPTRRAHPALRVKVGSGIK
jgi:hypothetical protein